MNPVNTIMTKGDPIAILVLLNTLGEQGNSIIGQIEPEALYYSPIKLISLLCLTLFYIKFDHPIFFDKKRETFSFGIKYDDEGYVIEDEVDIDLNNQIINEICEYLSTAPKTFCVMSFLNHLTNPSYNHANIGFIGWDGNNSLIINIYEPHGIFMNNNDLNRLIQDEYRQIFTRLQEQLQGRLQIQVILTVNFPCPIVLQTFIERDIPGSCQLIGILYLLLLLLKVKNSTISIASNTRCTPVFGRPVISSEPVIDNSVRTVNIIKGLVYLIDSLSYNTFGCFAETYKIGIQTISHYKILNNQQDRPYYLIFMHHFLLLMCENRDKINDLQSQQQQMGQCDAGIVTKLNALVIPTLGIDKQKQIQFTSKFLNDFRILCERAAAAAAAAAREAARVASYKQDKNKLFKSNSVIKKAALNKKTLKSIRKPRKGGTASKTRKNKRRKTRKTRKTKRTKRRTKKRK
jgi:hypothetical protein